MRKAFAFALANPLRQMMLMFIASLVLFFLMAALTALLGALTGVAALALAAFFAVSPLLLWFMILIVDGYFWLLEHPRMPLPGVSRLFFRSVRNSIAPLRLGH